MYKILLGLFLFHYLFPALQIYTQFHNWVPWICMKAVNAFSTCTWKRLFKKVHQEHLIHYSIHKTELRKKQEVKVPSIPPIPSFPFAKLQCCYPSLLNDSNNSLKNQVSKHVICFFFFSSTRAHQYQHTRHWEVNSHIKAYGP